MNQVARLGFFSCLWHRIIKKGRREKEEKREEGEKKEREKRGEKIHKFKPFNFQALFSLASSLSFSRALEGASPELESVYYTIENA